MWLSELVVEVSLLLELNPHNLLNQVMIRLDRRLVPWIQQLIPSAVYKKHFFL